MQADNNLSKDDEVLYYAAYYVSQKYQEMIFATMRMEFIDQLFEHEPVMTLPLDSPPARIDLAAKSILALSNVNAAKKNHLFPTKFSGITQPKFFFKQIDYLINYFSADKKETHRGKAYYDMPGYQASIAKTIKEFDKYYLHFFIEATNSKITVRSAFNEWNPVHLFNEIPLGDGNNTLGVLLQDYSRHCL